MTLAHALLAQRAGTSCSETAGLTVRAEVLGGGEIVSDPAGISCMGTRECEPHHFARRETVRLTARPTAGGSPFAGWLVWSGEKDDEPILLLAENLLLSEKETGRDGVVHTVAFFGIQPDLGYFGKGGDAGRLGGAGGSGGSSDNQGGTGGALPPRDSGTGGGGVGVGAGGANAGGQTGAAGGTSGQAGPPTCIRFTPNPIVAPDSITITGTGFGSDTTVTTVECTAEQYLSMRFYRFSFERVTVVSDSELQAAPPRVRVSTACVLRVRNQNGSATCPENLTIK